MSKWKEESRGTIDETLQMERMISPEEVIEVAERWDSARNSFDKQEFSTSLVRDKDGEPSSIRIQYHRFQKIVPPKKHFLQMNRE